MGAGGDGLGQGGCHPLDLSEGCIEESRHVEISHGYIEIYARRGEMRWLGWWLLRLVGCLAGVQADRYRSEIFMDRKGEVLLSTMLSFYQR